MGLTATEVGRRIGASAEVVNRLLREKGLTYGEPGAYGISKKGAAFGAAIERDNGYGGWAHRDWGWNSWDESVIDQLDATPEKIAEMSAALKAAKAAKRAADKLEAEQYWASVMADKAGKLVQDSTDSGLTNGQKAAIAIAATTIVVVGGVLVYKGVKRHAARKAARADPKAATSSQ